MTKAKLVFDPFSQDFFNGAYETYRRMREEAPVYYNSEHDFYALTRHEDVAPAFKDFETYSSRFGVDLSSVRSGLPTTTGMKMIIFMDPPEHRNMRSLLNKVFTPRAIQAQQEMVTAKVEKYLHRLDPDGFDAVQEFTAPFPVEVITTMLGAPEDQAQQFGIGSTNRCIVR
jgi:cytochrome P450